MHAGLMLRHFSIAEDVGVFGNRFSRESANERRLRSGTTEGECQPCVKSGTIESVGQGNLRGMFSWLLALRVDGRAEAFPAFCAAGYYS